MQKLEGLARLIRYYSLVATTEAGSGHLTSSLSAADIMTVLMFGGFFRYDAKHPEHANNDRLIFSKGHASPLFYALWAAAGVITEKKLLHFRKFTKEGSDIQGHPTVAFRHAEATTGSLGQGLSVGVGFALDAKYLEHTPSRIYVLLGDSEMAEGSVWEAMAIAAHYKLNNLTAIVDVNRLGQRGETMHGHETRIFADKARAFGWEPIVIDGHDIASIQRAFKKAQAAKRPSMIIARTLKGKGISMVEDKDNWHGKPLGRSDMQAAMTELGRVDKKSRGSIAKPMRSNSGKKAKRAAMKFTRYSAGSSVATRKAYGNALANLGAADPDVVVLDAETSNSTYAEVFKHKFPRRFFEMFIAEQNMAGVAQGLSRRGKRPFVSSFAAFLTRAFDQVRMGAYSESNVKFCGSHAGVSIGEDGISQMGLEDISMFRSIFGSTVVYPGDAPSTERLVAEMAKRKGTGYIRTTRKETPVLYGASERFPIGGSKTLRTSRADVATILAAGITLHEALAAYEVLKQRGILARVIDLYSIKPLDIKMLHKAARETSGLVVVEDHYPEGGIGEAVLAACKDADIEVAVQRLAVRKMARSGKPDELLSYEGIDAHAIVAAVQAIARKRS